MRNKEGVPLKRTTVFFEDLFRAIKFANNVRSYHFEVYDFEKNLVGYGVPK